MMRIEAIGNDEVPYDLLLLADESDEQIGKYKDSATFLAARLDGRVVGIIGLNAIEDNSLEIVNLAVDESHQDRKIGTELLKAAISMAKAKSYREMVIKTGNCGIKQLYLYQRVGFRFQAINKDYFLKNYPLPIYENGIRCFDQIVLTMPLAQTEPPASSSERKGS